ncbi:MAG TPA: response regulator [Candidatus Obscuribacterales bacterium]
MTRVLIAEDSTVIQKLLQGILIKDKSIEIVAIAADGEAAVRDVRQYKPDFVIMDYRMPKQNAPECIKQIMSDTPVPIMVFTGADPTEPKKQEVMALGAVGFMEKPKTMDYNPIATKMIMNIKTLSRLKPAKRSY